MKASSTARMMVPGALAILVLALAVLQYRWLGQVSEAERQEMRASMERRAGEFAGDVNREITALYDAIIGTRPSDASSLASDLGTRLAAWRASARFPGLVSDVYLAAPEAEHPSIDRLTESRQLETIPWPAELDPIRRRLLVSEQTNGQGGPNVTRVLVFGGAPVVSEVPALMIWFPQPFVRLLPDAANTAQRIAETTKDLLRRTPFADRLVIVRLNRRVLIENVVAAAAERHFGASPVRLRVVDALGTELFTRGPADGAQLVADAADVVVPLLFVGSQAGLETQRRFVGWTEGAAPAVSADRPVRTVREDARVQLRVGLEQAERTADDRTAGTWRLLLQHPSGSLDRAVATARRRNLYLSFGILSILAVATGLVLVNARRAERLAATQMDFVAAVSHELRTPVAVIRAAAENLAAGIVVEPGQAQRYGVLIETEGKRLTDMVEQVLAHAGINAHRRAMRLVPVDAAALARRVVESMRPLAEQSGFSMQLDAPEGLPPVRGEETSLAGALENLIDNAMRHAGDGRWVSIAVRTAEGPENSEVEIEVEDRGPGIDPRDRAHLFEPFYRGHMALDRQIKGSGLGLSLVRRTVEDFGGRVFAVSAEGQGARFVIRLPAMTSGPQASETWPGSQDA